MAVADASDHAASTECDTISCTGTTVTHTPQSSGHACTTGGTVCDGAGSCVSCNAPTDCAPTGNECIVRTCTSHVCGTMNLGQTHTLTTGQTPGDCQKIVCNGAGGMTSADDATDLPTSSTVCLTSPACTGAPLTPSFTPASMGTDCTADGVTNHDVCGGGTAAGLCVECNADPDCVAIGMTTCDTTTHTCS